MRAYSYKEDPKIPDFPDQNPIVVFDGVCKFCSRSMRIVFKHEKQPISFIPTQSELGAVLLEHYGLDPQDPTSFIFLNNGVARFESSGIFGLFRHVKGWPSLLKIFAILPRPLTNYAYRIVARNRYKWFGKSDVCIIPPDEMKSRMLDIPVLKAESAA